MQATGEERVQQLLSPERRERLDVNRILSLVPLRPYMAIADIGCGPGLFTIPLAKFLWDGKVYAVDVDEAMLEAVRKRAAEVRLGNVVTLKAEPESIPLEATSVDGVLLACVLHEVSERAGFLKRAAAVLRRTGWCAIIEWRPEYTGEDGPPAEHRIGEEEAARLGTEAGLRLSLRRELSDHYYLLLLTK